MVMCAAPGNRAARRASAGQNLAGMPSFGQFETALRLAEISWSSEIAVGPPRALMISSADRGCGCSMA